MATVVGRDRELEALAALLDLEPDGERILLLEGEAGIGKTTLWRAGIEIAEERDLRVLSCAPAGAETQLAFTILRDLLTDAFDEVADELPAPQRHALEVALLRVEPTGPPPGQGVVAVAFLSGLRALAARTRIVLAVDDVHWLDVASAALLRYALRRLETEPIVVLLARRTGERELLELERLDPRRVRALELGVLSVGALGRIIHDRLGITYPRPTLNRVRDVSGGNTFYALELARALCDSMMPLRPGDPIPVPGNLLNLVKDRLAALPARTFDVLAVASALARPTSRMSATARTAATEPMA